MDSNKFIELGQVDKREFDLGETKIITIPPKTEEIVVEPSKQEQTILPSEGKYIDKVVARAVTSDIDSNIAPLNIRTGVSILGVEGNLQPDKPDQEKSVQPSESEQRVVADIGYELSAVNVGAIQTENLVANNNGEYSASQGKYIKNVSVNVPVPNLSETTATENDVASGKVFYNASGEKTTGTHMDRLQWKCDNMKSLRFEFYEYQGNNLDDVLVGLDTSNVTDMRHTFYSCSKLTTIPQLNTSNVTNTYSMFNYCSSLITIPEFDMNKVTDAYSMLSNCRNLTNLTLKNIKVSIDIGSESYWGHLLTDESIINTIQELWDNTDNKLGRTKTLTLSTPSNARTEAIYVKLIAITDEMRANDAYIDNKKPCVICESTDEGAMTLKEYAISKNWQIA